MALICYMLNVCVLLSRCLNPVIINAFGIFYMLNVCVLLSRCLDPVIINGFGIWIWYMLNVCVCCLVFSTQ